MSEESALVAARARAVASLLDAHPDLPVPSFYISEARTIGVKTHLDSEAEVDAWAAEFAATPVTEAYTSEDALGLGHRRFFITHDGVEFDVWCQVEVRQVVTA